MENQYIPESIQQLIKQVKEKYGDAVHVITAENYSISFDLTKVFEGKSEAEKLEIINELERGVPVPQTVQPMVIPILRMPEFEHVDYRLAVPGKTGHKPPGHIFKNRKRKKR